MSTSSREHGGDATRIGRGLRPVATLLFAIVAAAAVYGLYLMGQLDEIRRHNLQRLDLAADAIATLVDNSRTTVANLANVGADPQYACTFFQRQVRLELISPECSTWSARELAAVPKVRIDSKSTDLELIDPGDPPSLRIKVRLDVIIDEIPFGDAFDQLLIVKETGSLVGSGIRPRRSSPMQPPGVDVDASRSPIRVIDLAQLAFLDESSEAPAAFTSLEQATFVRRVTLAGASYELMCQPLRVTVPDEGSGQPWWRLCGLTESQRSFRRALDVAPHVVMVLLAIVTLTVVSWPILKVLSIAPQERIRFADLYLVLVSTLALTIVVVVGIADIASYWELRERSNRRLHAVAEDVSARLRHELQRMYRQLQAYDLYIERHGRLNALREEARAATFIPISCLHGDTAARAADPECQQPPPHLVPPLRPPTIYPWMELAYWMRPCDGRQLIKATPLARNTPPVSLGGREYFRAVRTNRLWSMPSTDGGPSTGRFYVETSASVTTGLFFAAISAPSRLTIPGTPLQPPQQDAGAGPQDCPSPENERFVMALTAQPVSLQYPVLAPGVGFAIVDASGRAVFHSDVRRAVYENLLDDQGLSDRLGAALAARAQVDFYAAYQTRPHQVHVRPIPDLPFFVVAFADDEVIRTWHVEWLVRTAILAGFYLFVALLMTAGYMLVHGREPPTSVWPRCDARYRPIYLWTIWSLAAQLGVLLLCLHALHGGMLLVAALALPAVAFATVALAAHQAQRLSAETRHGNEENRSAPMLAQHRRVSLVMAAIAIGVALAAMVTMRRADPVAASQAGGGWTDLFLLLMVAATVATPAGASRRLANGSDAKPGTARPAAPPVRPLSAIVLQIVATTLLWLLIGALPGYAFYKVALSGQMADAARQEQQYVARALDWRACEVRDDFRLVPQADRRDALVRTRLQLPAAGDPRPMSDVYPRALLTGGATLSPAGMTALADGPTAAIERAVFGVLPDVAPIYNDTVRYSRYLEPLTPPGDGVPSRWYWSRMDGGLRLVHEHRAAAACDDTTPGGGASPVIATAVAMQEPHLGAFTWSALAGGLLLLVAWVSYGVRRIFFGDVEEDARPASRERGLAEEPQLEYHPARLGRAPDLAWARAEVAPLAAAGFIVPDETVEEWCRVATTRRAIVDRVLDEAHDELEALWATCSLEEQLLLVQLVEEGVANPKQAEVVRGLLRRGLLRRDPVLRPMNHSFSIFVAHKIDRNQVKTWERAVAGLRWSRVRGLLLTALAAIVIFLALTQRDAVEVWMTYLGTAAAGTAGVMKLLGVLSRPAAQKIE